MKLYINAGTDSYELASLFSESCKQQMKIDPKLKVAIGNMSSEISRKDKLCIYIESAEQAKKYIEILETIKKERQDFTFEKPMPTVGTIDNWIGIGSDIGENSSYNKDICSILIESCNKHFSNMNRNQIIERIMSNPNEVLDEVRHTIAEESLKKGRSPEKICVKNDDKQMLQQTSIDSSEMRGSMYRNGGLAIATRSFEEIISGEITPEEISEELMQTLRQNGYDGKSGNSVIQSYYKLYCRNQDEKQMEMNDGQKIDSLLEEINMQNDTISALKSRSQMFENIMQKQKSLISSIIGTLGKSKDKIDELQNELRPKSLFARMREMFGRDQKLLPETSSQAIVWNMDWITKECDRTENFKKQNMPPSVEEIVKGKKSTRERAKALEKENENSEGLVFPS